MGGSGGNDGFGSMQATPSFPAYLAFENSSIAIGFEFSREMGSANTHIITAHFKNKTLTGMSAVSMQVAAQKYMSLKMKPASGTSIGASSQDLTQQMVIVNSAEGQKPLSLKLKINYTPDGSSPQSEIKVVNNMPTNY